MAVVLSFLPDDEVYDVGDPITVVATVTNNGIAAAPGAIFFRERNPSGEYRLLAASEDAVGTYSTPITLGQAGLWRFRVECSGANAGVDELKLHVRRSAFPPL